MCPDTRAVSASHERHECTTDVGDTATVASPVTVGGPSRGSTGTQVSTSRETGQSKTALVPELGSIPFLQFNSTRFLTPVPNP